MRDARITTERGRERGKEGRGAAQRDGEREGWGVGRRNGERKYSDGEQDRGLEREK